MPDNEGVTRLRWATPWQAKSNDEKERSGFVIQSLGFCFAIYHSCFVIALRFSFVDQNVISQLRH
jgi:hypothetical protein